jgi:alpha-glucosidase (family GH31 glycosyl hydrolase)
MTDSPLFIMTPRSNACRTMWTDIDYLDHRRVFSLDPDRFPLPKMREIVRYLHDHQQKYILMVDPAVAKWDYSAHLRGRELDVFLKSDDDHYFEGVVWPVSRTRLPITVHGLTYTGCFPLP